MESGRQCRGKEKKRILAHCVHARHRRRDSPRRAAEEKQERVLDREPDLKTDENKAAKGPRLLFVEVRW